MKTVLLMSLATLLACGKKPAESNADAAKEAAPVEAPAAEEKHLLLKKLTSN